MTIYIYIYIYIYICLCVCVYVCVVFIYVYKMQKYQNDWHCSHLLSFLIPANMLLFPYFCIQLDLSLLNFDDKEETAAFQRNLIVYSLNLSLLSLQDRSMECTVRNEISHHKSL